MEGWGWEWGRGAGGHDVAPPTALSLVPRLLLPAGSLIPWGLVRVVGSLRSLLLQGSRLQ